MIRVVLADDHRELRTALRLFLRLTPHIEVVSEAASGREAIVEVERFRPDVLVMDVQMPDLDGLAAARHIRDLPFPPRILLISMYKDNTIIRAAAAAGVHGFIYKGDLIPALTEAIEVVHEGGLYFPDGV